MLILPGGLAAPYLRYATLADEMATAAAMISAADAKELETIAAHSRHNARIAGRFLAGLPAVLVHEHHSAVQVQRQLDFAGTF